MSGIHIVGVFINHDKKEFSSTARVPTPNAKLEDMKPKEARAGREHTFVELATGLDKETATNLKNNLNPLLSSMGYKYSPRKPV